MLRRGWDIPDIYRVKKAIAALRSNSGVGGNQAGVISPETENARESRLIVFDEVNLFFDQAAARLGLNEGMREMLKRPWREL